MPKDSSIKHILIIGSGPIVIGQACEFDYAGSQAARSLRDEGIEVTLINSNPATIMTDKVVADNIYLKPLTVESIEEILQKHDIDAVLPTMGGQTALNLSTSMSDESVAYARQILSLNFLDTEITKAPGKGREQDFMMFKASSRVIFFTSINPEPSDNFGNTINGPVGCFLRTKLLLLIDEISLNKPFFCTTSNFS